MLLYTILVISSLHNTQNVRSAFLFSKMLIKKHNNRILNVFFYGDGVLTANNFIKKFSDDVNLIDKWYQLSKKFNINLNVCSNDAQSRGIISNQLAKEIGLSIGTIHHGFKLTGLGTLIQSILQSDRVLQF